LLIWGWRLQHLLGLALQIHCGFASIVGDIGGDVGKLVGHVSLILEEAQSGIPHFRCDLFGPLWTERKDMNPEDPIKPGKGCCDRLKK
jgi:hypothetical protein